MTVHDVLQQVEASIGEALMRLHQEAELDEPDPVEVARHTAHVGIHVASLLHVQLLALELAESSQRRVGLAWVLAGLGLGVAATSLALLLCQA